MRACACVGVRACVLDDARPWHWESVPRRGPRRRVLALNLGSGGAGAVRAHAHWARAVNIRERAPSFRIAVRGCVLEMWDKGGGRAPACDLGEGHGGTRAKKVDLGRRLTDLLLRKR